MFTEIDTDPQAFDNRFKEDGGMYVRFYVHPELDQAASEEKGRAIYREVEYVEIRAPGNSTSIIQRRASDMDRRRFQKHYTLFKDGQKEQQDGTPLMEVPWISRAQVEELNYLRIRTLEALSKVADSECAKFAGLYDLKRKAGEYLAKRNSADSELVALRAKVEALEKAAKATVVK